MPRRLRPKTPLAAGAILVGDPGRSLLLAQELLVEPKMSNHARGLWGYTGLTDGGEALTIQATGMGGPSAALVLADLAELGVRRAVRVGTCAALGGRAGLGELIVPGEAIAAGGSAAAFGLAVGAAVRPDPALANRLREAFAEAPGEGPVASFDSPPSGDEPAAAVAADLQTVAVLARGGELGMAAAAILVVAEDGEEGLGDEELEELSRRAGRGAAKALSNPQVEG